jgi:1,4-alpha-glucan branching enzyme
MTTQTGENSAAKNGSRTSQARVSGSDVSRTVGELETRHGAEHDDTKVQVQFKVAAGQAKSVSVAGTFNGWSPGKTPLKKNGGAWKATVALPRGRYEYRLVVDGQWMADPGAKESIPNPFGGANSVLSV